MGHNHSHDHSYGHEEHGHHHAPVVTAFNRNRVGLAAVLTGLFMVAEVIGGLMSGSLALLADAGHMMTDFAGLSMAWLAFVIARRPATWRHTFGFARFSILVAFVNGLTLFFIAALIVKEAIERFMSPGEILAGTMLYVAFGGLIINIVVFLILRGADQHNLNIRGALLHVLGDLLGSVAAIAAAVIILYTGWTPIDPILSVFVALIILRSAWRLVKDSGHILLEGAPKGFDRRDIKEHLLRDIPELVSVDDIHIWSVTPEWPMLTLQAFISDDARIEPVSHAIKRYLFEKYDIQHVTIDVMRQASKGMIGTSRRGQLHE